MTITSLVALFFLFLNVKGMQPFPNAVRCGGWAFFPTHDLHVSILCDLNLSRQSNAWPFVCSWKPPWPRSQGHVSCPLLHLHSFLLSWETWSKSGILVRIRKSGKLGVVSRTPSSFQEPDQRLPRENPSSTGISASSSVNGGYFLVFEPEDLQSHQAWQSCD